MQNTAQPLLAYRLSGRPFDLGLIGFALTVPTFFLALPGGVLIEHTDKRRTVIAMQYVMLLDAAALAILTLLGLIQIWHLVLLSLILGIALAFEITARQAMLIELVGREALPNAIALQSTAFNISRVLGPALVAPLLLWFPARGEGWIFLLNALSFAAIILGLLFVRPRHRILAQPRVHSVLTELREGTQYLGRTSSVGLLILMTGILGLLAFPILQQLPVVSKDLLGQLGESKAVVDARNSWLYAAQGVGALIAAFSLAINSSARGRDLRLIAGQAVFILSMMALPFSHTLGIAIILVACMGLGSVTMLATMNMLIQLQVPNGLRGRVFSLYLWALQGVAPFGSLLIGWLTETWSLPTTAVACGGVCLLTVGGIQWFRLAAVRMQA